MTSIKAEHYVAFVIGVIATAAIWWTTEKMLDRHIGPRIGLG